MTSLPNSGSRIQGPGGQDRRPPRGSRERYENRRRRVGTLSNTWRGDSPGLREVTSVLEIAGPKRPAPRPRFPARAALRAARSLLHRSQKDEVPMKGSKLVGVVLLVLGILAIAQGGFSYVKDTDKVELGPIHIEVQDKERVKVPLWAGVLAAVAGGILIARKS